MPSIASGTRVRMVYSPDEATPGTPGTNPALQQWRVINRQVDLTKTLLSSQEVYADRNRRDVRHGFHQVAGQIGFELACAQDVSSVLHPGQDDWLESLLGGTWSGVDAGTLKVGTTIHAKTVERQFLDITTYESYAGVVANEMTLDFKPEAIVGGTFTLLGMKSNVYSTSASFSSGAVATPTTAPPYDTFIATITEGGGAIALATAVTLNVKANRQLTGVIGSKFSPQIFDGTCVVSGTLSAFFQDLSLLNKFINETPSSLVITCKELGALTRTMTFTLPNIKYSGGTKNPPQNGGVIQDMPFEALYDTTSGTSIQIDRALT